MPNRSDGTVWWTPEPEPDEDEPMDVDWIEHDPGAVPVGEMAQAMAGDGEIGFLEAADQLFQSLPPGYRTPKEGTR